LSVESVTLLLAILVILLTISLVLGLLLYSKNLSRIVERVTETEKEQLKLLSKLSGLIVSKDPMTYQMVQAMDSTLLSSQETMTSKAPDEDVVTYYYLKQISDDD